MGRANRNPLPDRVSLFMQIIVDASPSVSAAAWDRARGIAGSLLQICSAIGRSIALLAVIGGLTFSCVAHADSLDDTLALFAQNKYPSTDKAVSQLAAEAPPQAAPILDALDNNRLFFNPDSHAVIYKTADGKLLEAKSGQPFAGSEDDLSKVRINNAIRSSIDAALGALTLSNADPEKRLAAASDVFKTHDPKGLHAIEAQLAKEKDPRVIAALNLARAAIIVTTDSPSTSDKIAAIDTLKARGDQDALNLIDQLSQKSTDPQVKAEADSALSSLRSTLAMWNVVQNLWYGLSASSVLLLAAIGLAITFGVMGVINMAHGEMVMLGAYTTYLVQLMLPPWLQNWSLAFAIPLAFVVAGLVGIAIEQLIIRFLYTRPLETLLATWGVSLILQQTVRSLFGPNNRQVTNPPFMSGAMHIGGLEITANRLWIIVLAILVFVGLQLVLRATSFGLRMRAVTQNRRMAAAMGISTARIDMLAFGLGSGVAGIAGVALSQIDNVSPNLGQGYIIDSFMVVVFGGVGNLWGTALGALMIGVANKILEPLIGAVQGQIVLLVIIILFIQKRPRGMFALKGRAVEA